MNKRLFPLLLICLLTLGLFSCKSAKHKRIATSQKTVKDKRTAVINSDKTKTTERATVTKHSAKKPKKQAKKVIKTAKKYKGTKYKYGGTSKRGMDCSGLVMTAFNEENIALPRATYQMAKVGDWVDIKNIEVGDLVFFATRKNSRSINHVGIVTELTKDNFKFIHSSSSRGVIESTLDESYWYQSYVLARRVL